MDRKTSTSFPDFTPTSGELARSAAGRVGRQAARDPRRRRGSPTPTPTPGRPRWPRGCSPPGAGKGTRVGLLAGNSPDWIVGWLGITRMGGVAVLLNTYNKAKELGWLLRHCDAQVLLTVDAPPRPRLPRAARAGRPRPAPSQEHERIFLESHPYLRSIWTWGDGPPAVGRARSPTSPRAATSVSDALLARVRERGHPGRPDGGRVLVRLAPPTRRAPSTPTAPPCATPTTSGRCATSSPTTCSTRRCRCSGWAGSASR